MIFTPRFFLILAISILLALGSFWWQGETAWSVWLTTALVAFTLLDLLLTPRRPLRVIRTFPPVLSQGRPATVRLEIVNKTSQRLYLLLRDSPPVEFAEEHAPVEMTLAGTSSKVVEYQVRSFRRGQFSFGPVFYRVTGPFGFVRRQIRLEQSAPIVVFPDVSEAGARDLALSLGISLAGQRAVPARGQGREFESLREFQRDDDYRYIDWKATAKKGKFICRQYEVERDQRLLIMLDLGRLMSSRIGPYTKLDYAVNAAVRLAQIALYKGDLVGLLLFSHEIAFYLPPHKGATQFGAMVQALVSAQPRRLEPNYRLVFNYVARRSSRRTLMVCFTDLLDLEISSSLVEGMAALLPRHLPMTVTISDSELVSYLQSVPETQADIYQYTAALEVWNDYKKTISSMQSRGVLTVNVPAEQLTLAAINRYLEIKRTARL